MIQNLIVATDAELIANVLYKGDTVYNAETGLEYRVGVLNTAGARTLAKLIADADIAISGEDYALSAVFGAAFPTADPLVVGEVWSNAGVLTVSAG